MSIATRFQFNAIMRAVAPAIVAPALFFPTLSLGQNAPADSTFTTMRVLNDRALVSSFFTYPYGSGVILPAGSRDGTTGLPTTAFCIKFAEGALMTDASVVGNWRITYPASAQRAVTVMQNGTITSHTFSGGVGTILLNNPAATGVVGLNFTDGGITGPLTVYDPTTYATWSVGGTPALFSQQFLGTTTPWTYMRMMDWANANADMVDTDSGVNSWALDTLEWTDRRTPANFYLNGIHGLGGGYPIEWQVTACNTVGKPGWFNVPELASDDYITQYATNVANNLSVGLYAMFELSNEDFNTGAAFWTYRKSGYKGQTEALAFLGTNSTVWSKVALGGYVSTFSSDGTTMTVVFNGGHGQTVGASSLVPIIRGANTGFSNCAATGAMTVVDANTITYPTSRPSTGGAIAGTVVLQSGAGGFLALNGASTLFATGAVGGIFDLGKYWHYRRVWQMAKLVKDAFAAAGRSAADCQPVLALQAGLKWAFAANSIAPFFAAQPGGGTLASRFKAVAVGGYLCLDQSGNINSGFGLTSSSTTPQTTDAVIAQLQQMADRTYGTYNYGTLCAWARDAGLEVWGYEIGLDTVGANAQTTTTQNACAAANADPRIQALLTEWIQGLIEVGFSKVGWFQTSTGTYVTFGCFNLGQTVAEVTSTSDPSVQSPKFKGVMAARTAWTLARTYHVIPCTLSGYDVVGNEAVVTNGAAWPTLSGSNLPNSTYGGAGDRQTYRVWLESLTPQSVPIVVTGDYSTSGSITLTAHVCDTHGNPDSSATLAGTKSNQVLGAFSVVLQPGVNYVSIVASANAANVLPHSVQFG